VGQGAAATSQGVLLGRCDLIPSSRAAPREVIADDYGAIFFFAGGHGAMWDLPGHAGLQELAARIYEAGGVVGAVCHGPTHARA
jgi:putative intracellular protease/amidase